MDLSGYVIIIGGTFLVSLAASYLVLWHYHTDILPFFLHRLVQEKQAGELKIIEQYHEKRLMPALQLLASQRVSFEPPTPSFPAEVEQAARSAARPQLKGDEIESIWDKVKATY